MTPPATLAVRETARLDALDATGLLESGRDTAFDTVAELVSRWVGTPIAAVSLVSAEREWFKSVCGWTLGDQPRGQSMGARVVHGGITVIPDLRLDPDFAAHPLVNGPDPIRFYAGVPVRTASGEPIGALCVMDWVPRTLTSEQIGFLEIVAGQLSHLIELRVHEATRDRAVYQFADRASLAFCVLGSDGAVLWANTLALDIFGYGRETVVGSSIAPLFLDPRRFAALFDSLRGGDVVRGTRATLLHRDGTARYVEIDGQADDDAHGNWSAQLVFRDVTTQTQQWKALGAYSSVFEVTLDLICTADDELHFTLLNPAWTTTLGWTLDELRAEPFTAFVHPDDLAATFAVSERLLASDGEVVGFRNRYRCRDGSYRTLSWVARTVNGTFIASARDISDEVAQQEELRRQNEVLRTISEAQSSFIDLGEHAALWSFVLDALLSITRSTFGLIAVPGRDASGPFLLTKALAHVEWDAADRGATAARHPNGLVVRNLDNLLGQTLRDGARVIASASETEDLARALPPGHPEVTTFAGLPLGDGAQLVGVVGLANRDGGYDDACIGAITPLLAFLESVMRSLGLAEERRAADARLQAVVDSAHDVLVTLDVHGRIESANRAARALLGHDPEALVGRPLAAILAESAASAVLADLPSGAPGALHAPAREVVAVRADGTVFDAEIVLGSFELDGTRHYTAFIRDVSARKHEATLNEQMRLNASLESLVGELERNQRERELVSECVELLQCSATLEEGIDVLALFSERIFGDGQVALLYVGVPDGEQLALRRSNAATEAVELDRADCWAMRTRRVHAWMRGGTAPACRHAHDDEATSRFCMPIFSLDRSVALLTVAFGPSGPDDRARLQFESRVSRYASAAQGLSGALSTIALQESLARLALVDELTGLSNRRAFQREAQRNIAMLRRAGRPYAMAMIDIDHFKAVNDSFGHEVGDRALRMVAAALRGGIRASDLVARSGGEEFAMLLCDADLDGVLGRLASLLDTVRRTCRVQTRVVTVSIGIVHSSALPDPSYESMLRCADQALYDAKNGGRDRIVVYDPRAASVGISTDAPSIVETDVNRA